jgi:hypothetical protein
VGELAPIRGTQSFVGVMVEVWKRPSLTALEVLWRWSFWVLVVAAVWAKAGTTAVMNAYQQFQISLALVLHGSFLIGLNEAFARIGAVWAAALLMAWACVAAAGRKAVMRRLGSASGAWHTLVLLTAARVLLWAGLVALWVAIVARSWASFVQFPLSRGGYPSYVPGFAVVLVVTLALFMLWCLVSWIFRLAAVLTTARGFGFMQSLRIAWSSGPLRGKLIEINLVMGIVKVALLVLAMVFSACPLPFASVETQGFLTIWCIVVGVVWLLLSDYFHVVRAAAYLRLWQAYESR